MVSGEGRRRIRLQTRRRKRRCTGRDRQVQECQHLRAGPRHLIPLCGQGIQRCRPVLLDLVAGSLDRSRARSGPGTRARAGSRRSVSPRGRFQRLRQSLPRSRRMRYVHHRWPRGQGHTRHYACRQRGGVAPCRHQRERSEDHRLRCFRHHRAPVRPDHQARRPHHRRPDRPRGRYLPEELFDPEQRFQRYHPLHSLPSRRCRARTGRLFLGPGPEKHHPRPLFLQLVHG